MVVKERILWPDANQQVVPAVITKRNGPDGRIYALECHPVGNRLCYKILAVGNNEDEVKRRIDIEYTRRLDAVCTELKRGLSKLKPTANDVLCNMRGGFANDAIRRGIMYELAGR